MHKDLPIIRPESATNRRWRQGYARSIFRLRFRLGLGHVFRLSPTGRLYGNLLKLEGFGTRGLYFDRVALGAGARYSRSKAPGCHIISRVGVTARTYYNSTRTRPKSRVTLRSTQCYSCAHVSNHHHHHHDDSVLQIIASEPLVPNAIIPRSRGVVMQ